MYIINIIYVCVYIMKLNIRQLAFKLLVLLHSLDRILASLAEHLSFILTFFPHNFHFLVKP